MYCWVASCVLAGALELPFRIYLVAKPFTLDMHFLLSNRLLCCSIDAAVVMMSLISTWLWERNWVVSILRCFDITGCDPLSVPWWLSAMAHSAAVFNISVSLASFKAISVSQGRGPYVSTRSWTQSPEHRGKKCHKLDVSRPSFHDTEELS